MVPAPSDWRELRIIAETDIPVSAGTGCSPHPVGVWMDDNRVHECLNSENLYSIVILVHIQTRLESDLGIKLSTGCVLKFPLLSSPQTKSQQEESEEEEEEEENAPQWHSSPETWRIAASVNSPPHNVVCMKWLFTLCPVWAYFFYFSLFSLTLSPGNSTWCTRGLLSSSLALV